MKNIGRYEGKDCWSCTKEEWLELKDRTSDGVIYIIGQDMVCANSIIGNYNGHRVDRYQEPYAIYHFERGKKAETKAVADIDFKEYTKVVDDFFKDMEKWTKN